MQSSTTKKVLVRRFERENILGFANPAAFLLSDSIEILLVSGSILRIPYAEVKTVAFVKDFDPPRGQVEQRTFQSRPKMEGLWVWMRLRDGEECEGLLANDLARLDAQGFLLTPPNLTGNTQRLFIPRQALDAMHVVAVVGAKSAKKPKAKGADAEERGQIGLFAEGDAG